MSDNERKPPAYKFDMDADIIITDESNVGFYIVSNAMVDIFLPLIGFSGLGCYNLLKRLANRDGIAYYRGGMRKVAELLNVSRNTIQKKIDLLVQYKLLEVIRPPKHMMQMPNHYRLLQIPQVTPGNLIPGGYEPVTPWRFAVDPTGSHRVVDFTPRVLPEGATGAPVESHRCSQREHVMNTCTMKTKKMKTMGDRVREEEPLEISKKDRDSIPADAGTTSQSGEKKIPLDSRKFNSRHLLIYYTGKLKEQEIYYFPVEKRDRAIFRELLDNGIPPEKIAAGIDVFAKKHAAMGVTGIPGVPALKGWWNRIEEELQKKAKKTKGHGYESW